VRSGVTCLFELLFRYLSRTTEEDLYRQELGFRIIGPRAPSFDAGTSALQHFGANFSCLLSPVSGPEPPASLLIVPIHPHVDKTASVLIHRAFTAEGKRTPPHSAPPHHERHHDVYSSGWQFETTFWNKKCSKFKNSVTISLLTLGAGGHLRFSQH
jgi:hypothetical protein